MINEYKFFCKFTSKIRKEILNDREVFSGVGASGIILCFKLEGIFRKLQNLYDG